MDPTVVVDDVLVVEVEEVLVEVMVVLELVLVDVVLVVVTTAVVVNEVVITLVVLVEDLLEVVEVDPGSAVVVVGLVALTDSRKAGISNLVTSAYKLMCPPSPPQACVSSPVQSKVHRFNDSAL